MKSRIFITAVVLVAMAGMNSAAQAATKSNTTGKETAGLEASGSWDAMEEMEMMQHRIDKMFKESFRRAAKEEKMLLGREGRVFEPGMSIKETDTEYIVSVDLPGVNKEDINVELKDRVLKISGERKSEVKKENEKVVREEQNYGSFFSSITLPEDVKTTDINAEYKNGVLKISMPRMAPAKKSEAAGVKIPVK